ncbi:MAG: hypothetical protein C5B49_12285 [Bdellovibrio sp.]|nr:MAG: hypothetical protein C5B49_12285 [Bdellovibrio sp.]
MPPVVRAILGVIAAVLVCAGADAHGDQDAISLDQAGKIARAKAALWSSPEAALDAASSDQIFSQIGNVRVIGEPQDRHLELALRMAPALKEHGLVLVLFSRFRDNGKVYNIPSFAGVVTYSDGTIIRNLAFLEFSDDSTEILWKVVERMSKSRNLHWNNWVKPFVFWNFRPNKRADRVRISNPLNTAALLGRVFGISKAGMGRELWLLVQVNSKSSSRWERLKGLNFDGKATNTRIFIHFDDEENISELVGGELTNFSGPPTSFEAISQEPNRSERLPQRVRRCGQIHPLGK